MTFNEYDFYCPKCSSQLDVNGLIHLKTERSNGDKGNVYLSVKLGDYDYKHEPEVDFDDQELVSFSCPSCKNILHSTKKPNFVALTMRVEKQFDFELLFSRKFGIQKTYLVTEDGIECYGKDCNVQGH